MTSVWDVLVVVYFTTAGPRLLVLNSTVKDVTHSGGAVVLQVTLTAGVDPCTTLSALTVTAERVNRAAANIAMIAINKNQY